MFSNFKRNQHALDSRIAWLEEADIRADRSVARWNGEIANRNAGTGTSFVFKTTAKTYGEDNKDQLLGAILGSMKVAVDRKAEDTFQRAAIIRVGTYRGFEIDVSCNRHKIQFTLTGNDSYEPDNLIYRTDDKFSLPGFINRIDNFLDRFEGWRTDAENSRTSERDELTKAKIEKGKPFQQQSRLENLRDDSRDVMTELKLMQADDNHISTWTPKSTVLQANAAPEAKKMRA